jgi:hypothetical protein
MITLLLDLHGIPGSPNGRSHPWFESTDGALTLLPLLVAGHFEAGVYERFR